MHYAILSCVHANADAFLAVVEDAEKRGVEQIVCLGDLVGFGPDPQDCVDIARERCAITTLGCHDESLLDGGAHLPSSIRATIDWSKEVISAGSKGGARLEYLSKLPQQYDSGGIAFLHGSPRDPVSEYLFAEDVRRDPRKLTRAFSAVSKISFVGHTHIPGVFMENPLRWTAAAALDGYMHYKKGEKVIVNVGSVGMPRDGDARACYLEIEKNELWWRRVDYDATAVAKRIRANDRLIPSTAQRLEQGI
ncbi:metallophosphoesterase family protein [bacterium]|nr:metallophosphoesterase family protein [bacterium]